MSHHNKVPQTRWLKTTDVYLLTVLEAWSPKSRSQQGWFFQEVLRENPSQHRVAAAMLAAGCITPLSASIFTRPSPHSPCMSSSFQSLTRTPGIGFKATLIQDALTDRAVPSLHLQRPLFQRGSHSEVLGGHTFRGNHPTHHPGGATFIRSR